MTDDRAPPYEERAGGVGGGGVDGGGGGDALEADAAAAATLAALPVNVRTTTPAPPPRLEGELDHDDDDDDDYYGAAGAGGVEPPPPPSSFGERPSEKRLGEERREEAGGGATAAGSIVQPPTQPTTTTTAAAPAAAAAGTVGQPLKGTEYPSAPVQLWSSAQERRVRWKTDLQVVTFAFMLYLLSFLDRTNIGQARLLGLQTQVLKGNFRDYQIALTVLYVPYIVFEIFSNLLMKRVGAGRWIPFLVTMWGVVATLQGIVKDRTGLFVDRFFLGLTEAGILPGLAVYLTFFYKSSEIQLRQALYFSGASLAGAFNGLLAVAVNEMSGVGGLLGWSWLMILEGIFTVLFGVAAFFLMPSSPSQLWGLNAEERRIAIERLKQPDVGYGARHSARSDDDGEQEQEDSGSSTTTPPPPREKSGGARVERGVAANVAEDELGEDGLPSEHFEWRHVTRAMTDPFVLLIVAAGFCSASGVYGVAFFLPTVINGLQLGLTTAEAQLLSVPPFGAAFVVGVLLALASDRLRWRWLSGAVAFVLATVGYAIALASGNARTQYAGVVVLTCGSFSSPPSVIAWMVTNTAGYYKRATAVAMLIMGTNAGGITASWIFDPTEAPRFRRGFGTLLGLNAAGLVLISLADAYVLWDRRRRRHGEASKRRVGELRKAGWSEARIRVHLGDRHPDYPREL